MSCLRPGLLAALLCASPWLRAAEADPDWARDLRQRLERIDADFAGDIGVYVHEVEGGRSLSFRGDESWYLASGVKVPVAIAVMRSIEAGELALDDTVDLRDDDYVDGAGQTNLHPPGTALRIDYLLDQMLVYSDNTASDMLIRTVGLERVNRIAQELVSQQVGITTLADVRRRTYGAFHVQASRLRGRDLLALKQAGDERARLALLAKLIDVPPGELAPGTLDGAFDAYYATHINAAPLADYAHMLSALVLGHALDPASTAYLLGAMERVQTGQKRLRAGLPRDVVFAHKTGTQHRRACDFGIVTVAPGSATDERHVVIAACTRGDASLTRSERALREIGTALTRSGALRGATPAIAGGSP